MRSAGRENGGRSWRYAIWVALCLGALAIVAWSPGFPGPYLFDDQVTPLGDPASQSLRAWATHLSVTLRPVTKLTYAMEAAAGFDVSPAPRRAFSLLLHVTSAFLLFLFVARLEPRLSPHGAALLAAIWLVHPVHADSVLAVSGRTALLSGLFVLASLLAMERRRVTLAAVLFLLACLSRETALAAALPLIVLAASRPERSVRARLADAAPIVIAAGVALLWCVTTPRYLDLAEYSFLGRPFWRSLYAQVGAVPVGLGLLSQPWRLSVDYGLALPGRPSDPLFVGGVFLYFAAAIGTALLWRRSRTSAVGLALWLAALLPTQSVIPKLDALANRPLSLALAGVLIAPAPLLTGALRRAARPAPALTRAMPVVAAAAALIVVLAFTTVRRATLYRSELAVWRDAAAKSRSNARPHLQYAMLLKRSGRDDEAWAALSKAHEIDPFSSRIAALVNVYRPEKGNS